MKSEASRALTDNDNNENDVQMVYLDENLSYRDERSAELCGEYAADEEITQSSSEELQTRHIHSVSPYQTFICERV